MITLPRYAHGSNLALAVVAGIAFDAAAGGLAWSVLNRLKNRDLSRGRASAAAVGVYVATFLVVVIGYGVALAFARS